jgi:hypothetical protein
MTYDPSFIIGKGPRDIGRALRGAAGFGVLVIGKGRGPLSGRSRSRTTIASPSPYRGRARGRRVAQALRLGVSVLARRPSAFHSRTSCRAHDGERIRSRVIARDREIGAFSEGAGFEEFRERGLVFASSATVSFTGGRRSPLSGGGLRGERFIHELTPSQGYHVFTDGVEVPLTVSPAPNRFRQIEGFEGADRVSAVRSAAFPIPSSGSSSRSGRRRRGFRRQIGVISNGTTSPCRRDS